MLITRQTILRKTSILLLIMIFFFSSNIAVYSESQGINLINMTFKGADIRDVLRSVAELAGINLVTEGTVQGIITVQLKNVTFEKALDLITQTQGLSYQWDDNTVVVATPEKMQNIYGKIVTSTVQLVYADPEEVKEITNGIYPNLNIQLDYRNNRLIIKGQANEIEEAVDLIKGIDQPRQTVSKIVELKHVNSASVEEYLTKLYPKMLIQQDAANNRLLINGNKIEVQEALSFIAKLDKASEQQVEEIAVGKDNKTYQDKGANTGTAVATDTENDTNNSTSDTSGEPAVDKAAGTVETEEEGNKVIKSVTIKYADTSKVKEQLALYYPGIKIIVDEVNKQLIINGNESVVQEALEIVSRLDIPRDIKEEILQLNYSDAEEIMISLNNLFPEIDIKGDSTTGQLILSGKRKDVDSALGIALQMDSKNKQITEMIYLKYINKGEITSIISDLYPDISIQVLNSEERLIIKGHVTEVNDIVALIKDLDRPLEIITKLYTLKHNTPEFIVEKLNKLYTELVLDTNPEINQIILKGKAAMVQSALELITNLEQSAEKTTKIIKVNYITMEEINPIVTELYPGVQIQQSMDKRELIVKGLKSQIEEISNFVKNIDQPNPQVIIEAKVVEISRTDISSFGVNTDGLTNITFLSDEQDNITGIGISFPDVLSALEKNGTANTLANPHLMTLNGKKARLLIGDRIPVEVEKVEEGLVTRSIEYIEAGITLEFLPWINADDTITLEVNPKVSSIGESIGTALPPINTREAETNIHLKDGQTFAIGGLIQDDIIESVSKVPLLGDIPILGQLFKHSQKNNIKTDLLIFITPRIVRNHQVSQGEDQALPVDSSSEDTEDNEETIAVDQGSDDQGQVNTDEETAVAEQETREVQVADDRETISTQSSTATPENRDIQGLSDNEIEEILNRPREEMVRPEIEKKIPTFYNVFYEVKDTSTVEEIAGKFGLGTEGINNVNGLVQAEISPGTTLLIPVPDTHLYRISQGETLLQIAARFNVDTELLKEINKVTDLTGLPEGTIIIIPKDITEYN